MCAPDGLETKKVLSLGGGRKAEWVERYREYVEGAVREGLEASPWEELKEQVVLGGERFVERVRSQVAGDEREQRGARRLAGRRPGLETVIGCVERVWGEKWGEFRDRHGDSGRDLVLYVGRTVCGLKLLELAQAVGMREYAAVAMAVKRYARQLGIDAGAQAELRRGELQWGHILKGNIWYCPEAGEGATSCAWHARFGLNRLEAGTTSPPGATSAGLSSAATGTGSTFWNCWAR